MRFRALWAAAMLVVAATVAGCGSDRTASRAADSGEGDAQATFVLSEWKVSLRGSIPAGDVTVKVDNQGTEEHELVLVAVGDAATLATAADGSIDEDKIADKDNLGESGDVPAGRSETKTFTFAPGTYVAFCNIVDDMGATGSMMMDGDHMAMDGSMGHVHYALGMYTTFTVE